MADDQPKNNPPKPDPPPQTPPKQGLNATTALPLIYVIPTTLAIVAIIYAFYQRGATFLTSLQNLETARGLITFLVVFTTIVISITLVAYVATTSDDKDKVKDRFGFGKEVLTALIGILGTILGFYFGQSTTSTALQFASAYVSNVTPKPGDSVVLYSVVSGGKPPYKYTITFSPANMIDTIAEKSSATGVIQEQVTIPDKVPKDKDTDFTFQIVVTDSAGKSATYNDTTKKFTVKGIPKT